MPIDNERNRRALDQLLQVLRTGQSFAVTGAGVSAWAGYGTWAEIIRRLAGEVAERRRGEVDPEAIIHNHQDLLICAQHLGRELAPSDFGDFIQREFGPNGLAPHEVLFRIAGMPFRHFITLNFDRSVEETHGTVGLPCGTISGCNRRSIASFLREMDCTDYFRQVVHVHGTFLDPPDAIALTEHGYTLLYRDNQLFRQFLWLLAASKRLVFLGFGFEDSDFLNSLRDAARDVRDNGLCHFAIVPIQADADDAPIRYQLNERYLIEPIFYELLGDGRNPYDGFVGLINGISGALGIPERHQEEAPRAPIREGPPAAPEDVHRAAELGNALLDRIDPGGDDVPA